MKDFNSTNTFYEKNEIKSTLVSKNITVNSRRTSVRLEPEMWSALNEIADRELCSIHEICTLIYLRKKENTSLTAAIRVFIMLYFRAATTESGHAKAGHGNINHMRNRARINNPISRRRNPETLEKPISHKAMSA
ncbi:MAG: ribbon-helix-helix domain-containing protein [Micavibrio sp.]|nr:ribbon-helix-helix domain-containing protein [Micavibrio sp.]